MSVGYARHRPWACVAGAGLVAGLVLLGGLTVACGGPSDAAIRRPVRAYFAALARGDASAALKVSDWTGSRRFLTDTVLAQQRAMAKLTRFRVVSVRRDDGDDTRADVSVRYTMGGTRVEAALPVSQDAGGSRWLLDDPTVRVELDMVHDVLRRPTIFGQPVGPRTLAVAIFPGPVRIGATDPDLVVTNRGETYKGNDNALFTPGRESVPTVTVTHRGRH